MQALFHKAMKSKKNTKSKSDAAIRRFGGLIDVHIDGDIFINNGKGRFHYVGFIVNEDILPAVGVPVSNPAARDLCKALKKVLKEDDLDD